MSLKQICMLFNFEYKNTKIKSLLIPISKMKIEFFSAQCTLCEKTYAILNERFPNINIDIHRASECKDGSCCDLATRYGVRAIPSLVVDGKIILTGLPSEQDLKFLESVLKA